MRIVPLILSALSLLGLIRLLDTPLRFGDKNLPPLGRFFNPNTGFWRNAERLNAQPQASVKIPGIKGPVEAFYDDMLVPHIFAENIEDAFRAQGYITASLRLWQMDVTSRQTAGRLSEMFGERALEADRIARRRGLLWAAENDWAAWSQDPRSRAMLEAYAEGVNAYIAQLKPASYPLEYKLLACEPEPWTPLKTALIVENMIDALNNRDNDLSATQTLQALGRETFDYLYPQWFDLQVPVVPDYGQWKDVVPHPLPTPSPDSVAPGSFSKKNMPERALPASMRELNGSNNWAVAPAKTRDGVAILCNDMHLPLRLPHVWFQQQIATPEMNVYGVTVPGVPGVAVGFNQEMAWGFTNVSQEVADWYRIRWADAKRETYLLDGQPLAVEYRIETIGIKNKPAFSDTVRYTVWGPVTYDFDSEHPLRDCAYRYTTHDQPAPESIGQFLMIGAAKTYEDYRKAIQGLDCLSQNVAFATARGEIAITVQGQFPVRKPEQGRFVQEGDQSANAWSGFVPNQHLPALRNPKRGYVASANQHSTPPSFPYYYLGNFEASRGRRIDARLRDMRNITVDSMKALQLDNFSQRSADALPVLLKLLPRKGLYEHERRMADELARWDCRYETDATAPAMFEMWLEKVYDLTWDELDSLRARNLNPLYPEMWRLIQLLDRDTASVFFDLKHTPKHETASDIVIEAFRAMAKIALSTPPGQLRWDVYRNCNIQHIARIDALSRLNVRTGGTKHAPNAVGINHGPSWRMIVELSKPVRAVGVYPGGQSGRPGSPHYDDMIDAWAAGKYFDLLYLEKADASHQRVRFTQKFKS